MDREQGQGERARQDNTDELDNKRTRDTGYCVRQASKEKRTERKVGNGYLYEYPSPCNDVLFRSHIPNPVLPIPSSLLLYSRVYPSVFLDFPASTAVITP